MNKLSKAVPRLKQKNENRQLILVILISIVIFGLLWFGSYRYAKVNPGGDDFLVYWKAYRLFFQKGLSPYSDQTAVEVQKLIYGTAAQTNQHQMRMVYPLYSVLLFGPFSAIPDYVIARSLWMTFSELSLVGLSLLCIRISGWKPKRWQLIAFFIFSLIWYHAVRPVINGNAVIFIALGIAGILYAIKQDMDELAGAILALCTIKPQVIIGFGLFLLFWAIIRKRAKIILWFFITLGLLVGFSMLLIPDWILQNFREILRFSSYATPDTPASALNALMGTAGLRIGTAISILAIALVIVEMWLTRKTGHKGFLWVASLALVASQWFGISTDPGNFIVCFPAIVLIMALWQERWEARGKWLGLGFMVVLFLLLWVIFVATIQNSYQPIQSPVMFFPLPVILLIGLYWVRWWALKPPEVWSNNSDINDLQQSI